MYYSFLYCCHFIDLVILLLVSFARLYKKLLIDLHVGRRPRLRKVIMNQSEHIVSNTRKFDRGLTHFRRSQLHCLDVVDRVRFRVCVQVFRCLHKMAPEYLSTYCQPVWPLTPAIGWPWLSRFPTCETCFVRRTFICIRRPFELELTSCLP